MTGGRYTGLECVCAHLKAENCANLHRGSEEGSEKGPGRSELEREKRVREKRTTSSRAQPEALPR